MKLLKNILKIAGGFFALLVLSIFVVIPSLKTEEEIYTNNIDTNSTKYKEQYAIAIAKAHRSMEKENRKEVEHDRAVEVKRKKVADRISSKDKVSLKFSLKKGKYNIAITDFTIKNDSDGRISDVEIKCDYYAESGTFLNSSTKVIYQTILGNSEKKINSFSFGIMDSQSTQNRCKILSYMFNGVRVWY